MKRAGAALLAGAVMMLYSGCGSNNPTQPTPPTITVTIQSIGAVTLAGAAGTVSGTISTDSVITSVSMKILDSSGTIDKTADFVLAYSQTAYIGKSSVDLTTDLATSIKANPGDVPGTYVLDIVAATGSVTKEAKMNFSVTGTPVTDTLLTLGAQGAAPYSLLDADNMTTYSLSITDPSVEASIDAIFYYSSVVSPPVLSFVSPSVAQGSPFNSWTDKAASQFEDVTGSVDYSTISTQEQINYLWTSGAGLSRLTLSQDQVIVIYTHDGQYKLVKVQSINGDDSTATMVVKGQY